MLQKIIRNIRLSLSLVLVLLTLSQQPVQAIQHKAPPQALPEEAVVKGEHASYVVGKKLGSGEYGTVLAGVRQLDQMPVAIKYCNIAPDKPHRVKRLIEGEVACLKMCNHFGIVKFLDLQSRNDFEYDIVMELAEGLSADVAIYRNVDYKLLPHDFALVAVQLVLALGYMHNKSIIYRDLKPANIIFNPSTKLVKLCDFGFAQMLTSQDVLNKGMGTPSYSAPELYTGGSYSFPIDVWALGIVLFELLIKKPLFYSKWGLRGLMGNIVQNERHSTFSDDVPSEIKNFINSLLVHNPDQRPTMQEVLQQPYMKKCLCFFVWHVVTCEGIVLQEKIAILVQIMQQLLPRHDDFFNHAGEVELQEYLHILAQGILTVLQYPDPVTLLQLTGTHEDIFAFIPLKEESDLCYKE